MYSCHLKAQIFVEENKPQVSPKKSYLLQRGSVQVN